MQRAIANGDKCRETMELADYWLLVNIEFLNPFFKIFFIIKEKDLVPKLFQVLSPRYAKYTGPMTQIHNLPIEYPGFGYKMACLELKGKQKNVLIFLLKNFCLLIFLLM